MRMILAVYVSNAAACSVSDLPRNLFLSSGLISKPCRESLHFRFGVEVEVVENDFEASYSEVRFLI